MKKILLVLVLSLIVGCATGTAHRPKYGVCTAAAPTKEDILDRARFESELKGVKVWWALERVKLAAWFSGRSGMYVDVDVKPSEITFMGQYSIGMMHVHSSSLLGKASMYIIIVRPDGLWHIADIVVVKKTPPEQT